MLDLTALCPRRKTSNIYPQRNRQADSFDKLPQNSTLLAHVNSMTRRPRSHPQARANNQRSAPIEPFFGQFPGFSAGRLVDATCLPANKFVRQALTPVNLKACMPFSTKVLGRRLISIHRLTVKSAGNSLIVIVQNFDHGKYFPASRSR